MTDLKTWTCCRCKKNIIDADEHRAGKIPDGMDCEPMEFWIGPTSPICNFCAQELGMAFL